MSILAATCAKAAVGWIETAVDDHIIDAYRRRELHQIRQQTEYLRFFTLGLLALAIAAMVRAGTSDGWQMAIWIAIALGIGLTGFGAGSLWNRLRNGVWWS